MVGSQVLGNLPGVGGLVVHAFMKADSEGFHGTRTLRLHESDNYGRINSAGKKSSQRNIGNHAQAHRIQ